VKHVCLVKFVDGKFCLIMRSLLHYEVNADLVLTLNIFGEFVRICTLSL